MRRIGLVVGVMAIAMAIWIATPPFTGPPDPDRAPRLPDPTTGRPVALLLPATASADAFWLDRLALVFGAVDRIDPPDPEAWTRELEQRRLVVVGHAAGRTFDAAWRDATRRAARAGATIMVETPDTSWAALAGLRLATVERTRVLAWPHHRTIVDRLSGESSVGVPGTIDLPVSNWRFAPARDRARSALPRVTIAGRPGVWTRSVGAGAVISTTHHLSRLAVDAFAASPDARAPVLDAYTRAILHPDAGPSPWPTWSAAPFGRDGWIVTIESDGPSTTYSPSEETWRNGPARLRRDRKLGPVVLSRAVATIQEQLDDTARSAPWLHRFVPGFAPPTDAVPWAWLEGAGIDLHLTVHPFGSSVPVPARAIDGRAWDLRLLPPAIGIDDADLAAVLDRNAVTTAGPVVVETTGAAPRAVADHHVGSAAAFVSWWDALQAAGLDWTFDGATLIVTVDATTLPAPGAALLFARRWNGRPLIDRDANWSPARSRVVDRGGRSWLEVEVPTGVRGRIRVRYGS